MSCHSSGGTGGGGGSSAAMNAPQNVQTITYSQMSDSHYNDLYNAQNLTPAQLKSMAKYTSASKEPGSLYSLSQNMNYALAHGGTMTTAQQKTYQNMMAAMQDIGGNFQLQRYDHQGMVDGLLSKAGLPGGYEHYSIDQLRQALVGQEYTQKQMLSTSINDFANSPQSTKNVFQTRAVKMTYQTKSGAKCCVPGHGQGGDEGEVVFAPSQKQKIIGVNFTGKKARKKQTQSFSLNQIELIVEIGD